ncbi:hypothetical protein [Litorimonas sp. WD9-15]|uniref:hypothetical protein n=1 Tax=Litorimonas sp. WD9-15 TaxID=3418716 RepID=UPI003CFCC420
MSLPPREIHARRLLDTTYDYLGTDLIYRRGGQDLFETKGKVHINDMEQNLDGSRIEIDVKGFSLRLRRHTCPENFVVQTGDRIELLTPLEGFSHFHIDAAPRSFGRSGRQIHVGLTPTAAPATGEPSTVPEGLPLG